ncbi:MAG: C40 family peptidase [Bacteroidales bacterium]|nr:C40 family peptidase [Bacteroidales bacterium]
MNRHIILCLALIMLGIQISSGQTSKRWAVVELSSVYMRIAPDYESALETQELMGTVVEITSEQGYWREIVSPQPYKAWCTEKGLTEMDEEQIKTYNDAQKCIYTGLYGHIQEKPSIKSRSICDLVGGDILRYAGRKGRWTKVMLPSGKTGWVPSADLKAHKGFRSIKMGEGDSSSISPKETENIIAEAEKLVGVPYLWGGMTAKGVDCSGLVRISFLMNGILLPRNASQQIRCGDEVNMSSLDNLERGDLLFFGTPASEGKPQRITHVGIYLGDNRFIHSSHMVRINSLIPEEKDYYENSHRLIAARRL